MTKPAKISDLTIIRDIRAAMDEFYQYNAAANPDGSRRSVYQLHAASRKQSALIEAAAERFGEMNGWRRTDRYFGIKDIGRQSGDPGLTDTSLFDHCLYYRADRRCAAIICQPYGPAQDEEVHALAAAHGLACHIPPSPKASFHYPGATRFFVFTSREHQIVWFPEQLNGGSDSQPV